jgi:VIT1/CCC1 family predicted Fe2+/Mn2+ transporter
MAHVESHRAAHVGWLRAAVLGANDGLISTSSLVVGVASGAGDRQAILLAAVAGLVAGALSMAAGEYVSVSSQADTEAADLARERVELANAPLVEREELVRLQQARGLSRALAERVADELAGGDLLAAHAREELGITDQSRARPVQAALASAAAFAGGAAPPVAVAALVTAERVPVVVTVASLILLAGLGTLAARLGGAPVGRGAARVAFWGAMAMGCSALVGRLFGTTVG